MNNKTGNIYLTGFMCSGKTSTGRALAALLGRPFADSDRAVEKVAGCSIAALAEKSGMAAFRRTEAQEVKKLCAQGGRVVALGGGVYPARRWRGLLERTGITVFLDCGWEVLEERLKKNAAGRPLLAGGAPAALRRARGLLGRRLKYYKLAGIRIDAAGLTPAQAAALIAKGLKNHL